MRKGVFVIQEGYGRFCASFRLKHVILELPVPSWQFWGIKQKQSTKTEWKFIFHAKGETFLPSASSGQKHFSASEKPNLRLQNLHFYYSHRKTRGQKYGHLSQPVMFSL